MAQSVKVCGVDVDREEKVSGVEKCVVMRHQPWCRTQTLTLDVECYWKSWKK